MFNNQTVLLVSMPWASTTRPNLGIGLLVSAARAAGFECKASYPNLALSAALGSELYESLSETPALFGLCEHFFAVDLFGQELLRSDEYIDTFVAHFGEDAAKSRAALVHLRDQVVPQFIETCLEQLLSTDITVYGFSCTFHQVLASLCIAKRIKAARPSAVTLLGGACVHGSMGEAYAEAFAFVDHVFTGESDATFPAFLNQLRAQRASISVPGVTTAGRLHARPDLIAELDSLETPNYDDYFIERRSLEAQGAELAPFKSLPFESSRGCWWGEKQHCTFCGLNNEGMRYRSKSTKRVVQEVIDLARKYNWLDFMAADNILTSDGYRNLLRELANLGADLNIFYEIKANVRRDDVAALRGAGVRWVQPGIESFSDHVLGLMRKGTSGLQNIQLLKWLAEHDVHPTYNILVGFPGEKDEDYEELLALVPLLHHLPSPSGDPTIVQVHRFSPFFFDGVRLGIEGRQPERYYEHLIPRATLDAERFAYFFDRDIDADSPVRRYNVSLSAALQAWRKADCSFSLRLGPGFGEIVVRQGAQSRRQTIDLQSTVLLVLADHAVMEESLRERVAGSLGAPKTQVAAAIDFLVSNGFMLRHNGRALSLVPFSSPQNSESLRHWLTLWAPACSEGAPSALRDHLRIIT